MRTLAILSAAVGVFVFGLTNYLSAAAMEPFLLHCPAGSEHFPEVRAPRIFGDVPVAAELLCLTAGFFRGALATPAGRLSLHLIFPLAGVALLLMAAEPGRSGHRMPRLVNAATVGLLGQLLGIGVVTPLLWGSVYLWTSTAAQAHPRRARLVAPTYATVACTLVAVAVPMTTVMFVAAPAGLTWEVANVSFQVAPALFAVLWLIGRPAEIPRTMTAGSNTLRNMYVWLAGVSLFAYAQGIFLFSFDVGLITDTGLASDPLAVLRAVPVDPYAAFLFADLFGLFSTVLLVILAECGWRTAIELVVRAVMFGPASAAAHCLWMRENLLGDFKGGKPKTS